VQLTVGRHAAGDGAGVHPIVLAALTQRPRSADGATPRHGPESRQRRLSGADGEGGLGWPGEPKDGTGLGWPADLLSGAAAGRQPAVTQVADQRPVRRWSGWRRIFGSNAA
jgi:hypothetical protein